MSKSSSSNTSSIYPQEVIPKGAEIYVGLSYDRLLALGSEKLRAFRRDLRDEERSLTTQIRQRQHQANIFYEHSLSDLRHIASQYQPLPGNLDVLDAEGRLVTNNGERIDYAPGATTLNACGWCRYAEGDWRQGNCLLEPCCRIVPPQLDTLSEKRIAFRGCVLLESEDENLPALCTDYLKAEEALLLARRRYVRQKVAYLTRAIHRIERKEKKDGNHES